MFKEHEMSRNFAYIEGKLTDLELKKIGDKRLVQATVCIYNGGEKKPAYFTVELWNPTKEQVQELKGLKGEGRVSVAGILRQDHWEDKKGSPRSRIKIVASSISVAFDVPPRDDNDDRDSRRSGFKRDQKPNRDDDDNGDKDDDEGKKDDDEDDEKPRERNRRKSEEDDDVPF